MSLTLLTMVRQSIRLSCTCLVILSVMSLSEESELFAQPKGPDFKSPEKSAGPRDDDSSVKSPLENELESLRRRADTLRKEIQKSVEQRQKHEKNIRSKLADIVSLNEERKRIGEENLELELWQKAMLILGDAQSDVAAAVSFEGDDVRLIASCMGVGVKDRLYAAANATVPRAASRDGRDLARRIISADIKPGNLLTPPIAEAIHNQVWRPNPKTPWSYPADPRFVVFRDSESRRQRLGVFDRIEGNAMSYFPVGRERKIVERERIEPGSLRADNGSDILDAVEADEGFADYCALNILHHLTRGGAEPGFHAVGLHVKLNGIIGSLAQLDRKRVRKMSWHPSGLAYTIGRQFPSTFGGNRFALLAAHVSESASFDLDWSTIERDMHADLKRDARKIEDDLYLRLSRCGVPLIEKEHFDLIRRGKVDVDQLSSGSAGTLMDATHLVVADVDAPKPPAIAPRVNVRLIEVRSGSVLWMANSAELSPRIEDRNPFFPISGKLAVLQRDPHLPKTQELPLFGVEQPLKVEFAQSGAPSPPNQLVLLEGDNGTDYFYRSLFSPEIHSVPRRHVSLQTLDKGIPEVITASEFLSQQTRALVWYLASHSLTPAGRITEILENGKAYRVSVGTQHGINNDTMLRAYRPRNHLAEASAEEALDVPLPISLVVRSAAAESCIVVARRLGLDGYWEESTVHPRVGDLVYDPSMSKRKIAVFPPEDDSKTIGQAERIRMTGNNVLEWQKIIATQEKVANEIRRKLVNGFRALDVAYEGKGSFDQIDFGRRASRQQGELNVARTVEEALRNDATHAIGGYIRPTGNSRGGGIRYEVELRLFTLSLDPATKQGRLEETKVALPKFMLGQSQWK